MRGSLLKTNVADGVRLLFWVTTMALAYFITFSTYGTWLPGSVKGSVDRAHNVYDTPLLPSDPAMEQQARQTAKQPPYVLGDIERELVCQAVVTLSAERGWNLLAAHVRSNHVHVVIQADRDPGRLMSDLKARASRDLTRANCGAADRVR